MSSVREESEKTIQIKDDEISDLRIKLQEFIRNQESLLEKDNEILKLKAEAESKDKKISDLELKYDEDLKSKSRELSDFLTKFDADIKSKDDEIASLKAKHDSELSSKEREILQLTTSVNHNIEVLTRSKELLNSKDEKIERLENKVSELTDLNESLSGLKESFDHELERFKSLELSEVNLKLQNFLQRIMKSSQLKARTRSSNRNQTA